MHWRTRFSKVKHSLGDAWNTSMKVLSVVDRAHALVSKGYNAVQDRLEPEVRQAVGSALQTYGRRSRQINNLDTNVREIGRQVRQSFPEYL
jgi:hypothetical protein